MSRPPDSGADSFSLSRTSFRTTSTAFRDLQKARKGEFSRTSRARSPVASRAGETRNSVPRAVGGCQRKKRFSGDGEPSRETWEKGRPQMFSASSTGLAMVAELHRKRGEEP